MSFVSWLHSRAFLFTFTMVITPRALRQWKALVLWSCSMSGSVVDMAPSRRRKQLRRRRFGHLGD